VRSFLFYLSIFFPAKVDNIVVFKVLFFAAYGDNNVYTEQRCQLTDILTYYFVLEWLKQATKTTKRSKLI